MQLPRFFFKPLETNFQASLYSNNLGVMTWKKKFLSIFPIKTLELMSLLRNFFTHDRRRFLRHRHRRRHRRCLRHRRCRRYVILVTAVVVVVVAAT